MRKIEETAKSIKSTKEGKLHNDTTELKHKKKQTRLMIELEEIKQNLLAKKEDSKITGTESRNTS